MLKWNMKDYIFDDAVTGVLRNDKDCAFQVEKVYTPDEIEQYRNIASIVPMEVSCFPPYTLEERLNIRKMLKTANPDCKVVLIVDENSEREAAKQVQRAKKAGLIDQFIYGSVSASYLLALLNTL